MDDSRSIPSKQTIEEFLLSMRLRIAEGRWTLVQREKNLQALLDLGMVLSDVPEVLRSITYTDFCAGPLNDDKGRPLVWWVFGPQVSGETLYVKVALHPKKKLLCMSFHKSEFPLRYPFKEATET